MGLFRDTLGVKSRDNFPLKNNENADVVATIEYSFKVKQWSLIIVSKLPCRRGKKHYSYFSLDSSRVVATYPHLSSVLCGPMQAASDIRWAM